MNFSPKKTPQLYLILHPVLQSPRASPATMLFSSVTNIGFIIALAASSALAAVNTQQTVDDLNKVHVSINKARNAMDNWNGGLMGAIPVAHSVYNAQKTAEGARMNLGNTDPFEGDDKHQVMHAYKNLQPDIISALRAAEEKVYLRRLYNQIP